MADQKLTDEFFKISSETERTSPKAIAFDVLTSLILLCGAWVIERIKTFFPPPGPPIVLLVILNISELTLLAYFVVALLRAIISVFRELDVLLSLFSEGQTPSSIIKLMQAINDRRIKSKKTSLSYKIFWLGISFLLTLMFSAFLILVFWLSGLPANWGLWRVVFSIGSGIVFLLFVTWFNQRMRIRLLGAYEASGITIGCVIQMLTIAAVLYLTGYSAALGESFHRIITTVYFDRVGLIWSAISILVFAMILSIVTTVALEELVTWKRLRKP